MPWYPWAERKKLLSSKILYRTRRVCNGYGSVQALALHLRKKLTLVRPRSASYRFFLQLPMRKSLTLYHRRDMRPLRNLLNICHLDLRCGLKAFRFCAWNSLNRIKLSQEIWLAILRTDHTFSLFVKSPHVRGYERVSTARRSCIKLPKIGITELSLNYDRITCANIAIIGLWAFGLLK